MLLPLWIASVKYPASFVRSETLSPDCRPPPIEEYKLSKASVTFNPETVESFLTSVDGCLGYAAKTCKAPLFCCDLRQRAIG